jgi:hypothetical protein
MLSLVYGNKPHHAPIGPTPQRILDLGTGSGIWCIEMGDLYPSAEVTGVDLSANMPSWVPPNVHFEVSVNLLPTSTCMYRLTYPAGGRYRGTLDLQSPIRFHPREIPGQCDKRLARTRAPMFRVSSCPRSCRSILWRVIYRVLQECQTRRVGRVRRF